MGAVLLLLELNLLQVFLSALAGERDLVELLGERGELDFELLNGTVIGTVHSRLSGGDIFLAGTLLLVKIGEVGLKILATCQDARGLVLELGVGAATLGKVAHLGQLFKGLSVAHEAQVEFLQVE